MEACRLDLHLLKQLIYYMTLPNKIIIAKMNKKISNKMVLASANKYNY